MELENNPGRNQSNPNNNFNQFNMPQPVPNSVGALVLGILSIVFCWCYGILSVILGIIAIFLANQGEKVYQANPQLYTLSSYNNLKGGRVCAIIGLCLGGLYILFIIAMLIIQGTAAFNIFKGLKY